MPTQNKPSTSSPDNFTGRDMRTPYQEYPHGEAQYDDWGHRTGIGSDTFEPLVPVK